jgi:deoxyribodipyrimidine photo-lyase
LDPIPRIRIGKANSSPVNPDGDYVLYWMTSYRRVSWNYSLDRAVCRAKELDKPLVILEALRCGYEWASDRIHRFILDGMADNARNLEKKKCIYYPFVETSPDSGKGLLEALGKRACLVVTDHFPAFFLPRMVASASEKLPVLLERVDSNGLLPIRLTDKAFPSAYSFRRFLQKNLPSHLLEHPSPDPLKTLTVPRLPSLPEHIMKRWPPASPSLLAGNTEKLRALPVDHAVTTVHELGGSTPARKIAKHFIDHKLNHYLENRNHPDIQGTSNLAPYLHFGHMSAHEIFYWVAAKENWLPGKLDEDSRGGRSGWWGMGAPSEAFLDQLITWRELGFNMCLNRTDYDQYQSLPDWAKKTLKVHEMDERSYLYDIETLEKAETHDPLWNAAQRQLLTDGRIHNYLRMLWGKKILEWSATPGAALTTMIQLNNKYALDGRDPNSYSGIFWVLGRYDRAWGPERPVFGKIRYMSSKNTLKKVRVKEYIKRYGSPANYSTLPSATENRLINDKGSSEKP